MSTSTSFHLPSSASPALSPASLVVVVDNGGRRLVILDAMTHEIHDTMDLGDGDWRGSCGLYPHRSSENFLVAVSDNLSQTVKVFEMGSKRLVRSIGRGRMGPAQGQLHYPYFLCMYHPCDAGEEAATLLVSNQGSHRIDMFDIESGAYIRSIGSAGMGPGQLQYPSAIVVWTPQDDPTNTQVVVADQGNSRLQFFRLSDGMHVRSVGEAEAIAGRLDQPAAMSIHKPVRGRDEDALLVTIGYRDSRIYVFNVVSGEYLHWFGGGIGEGVDHLARYSHGITFYCKYGEAEDFTQVIISDRGNNRLQVFNLYTRVHICSIGGGDSGLFQSPFSVFVGSNDDWSYVLK